MWPPPRLASPSRPLRGEVYPPGDKSISHRALILGALAEGETRIEGLLESLDLMHTARALQAFGAEVERVVLGRWRVRGGPWRSPGRMIDCGNAGTTARLLIGAAAGFDLEATFTGDDSLRKRPMARVIEPLQRMGAHFEASDGDTLPLAIRGGGLDGIAFQSPQASAQVKSAVLLAGLQAAGPVEIAEPMPSRDHTERLLEAFGCEIAFEPGCARLGEQRRLTGTQVLVPGDPSSAAFPLVAALIVPDSRVTARAVLANPLRTGLFDTLVEMGADLRLSNRSRLGAEDVADIEACFSALRGVDVPAERAPRMVDEIPILAMAAAVAEGTTRMRGLGELRTKESDRIEAIVAGLTACGVEARAEGDDLVVEGCGGPPPGGGDIATEGDHRISMSFLVLGLAAEAPVRIDSGAAIPTSFPGFGEHMRSLGGELA